MIEVRDLVKQYGGHYAVDGLSFTAEDGQILGFLGPNGAGKSTTMNIMTGYLAATGGTVLIDGHDIVTDAEAARRRLGYLPEIPPVYGEMTVREQLLFVAELRGLAKDQRVRQAEQLMEALHIADMRDRLIRSLSKGYRQRVGLAQALLGAPNNIILDEPTVGLDPKQMAEVRELIRDLAKQHTVILSSHILSEIRAVCDRLLIIRKGRLVVCDTPQALEARLSDNGAVALAAKASPEQVEQLLRGIAGVSAVSVCASPEGETRAEISAGYDCREAVFRAFAQADCPLLTLHPRAGTLEEAFLELTDEDDAVAARALARLHRADTTAQDKEVPV